MSSPAAALAGSADAYEQVEYPGYAYPVTHPAHLEVLGRLFGLTPAPARRCRVLELGCGDGANALAIAHTLPEASVIGLDAAASAIERGRALAREAGVENLELVCGDLAAVDAVLDRGPFDYVVAHGVYSWIAPALRGSLLECCRRGLTEHGVAFVSYNAYPGSYLRDMVRDVLEFHLRGASDPAERLERAHGLMEAIVAVESPSPYARVLREHLQRMLAAGDALLYHDDMAPVSTPFYFHEFVEHATAHGLQFLSEAELGDSQMRDVPASVVALIEGLGADAVLREQYLDFFFNRMFRQTLLAQAEAPVVRAIDDRHLQNMVISSPARFDGERFVTPQGAAMTTTDPLLVSTMNELGERWPGGLSFTPLAAAAARRLGVVSLPPGEVERLRESLLHMYVARIIRLHSCALPGRARAGERPRVAALARAQAAAGRPVLTTLLSGNCRLEDEFELRLLGFLDGTRDRAALAAALDADDEAVERGLSGLVEQALVCG